MLESGQGYVQSNNENGLVVRSRLTIVIMNITAFYMCFAMLCNHSSLAWLRIDAVMSLSIVFLCLCNSVRHRIGVTKLTLSWVIFFSVATVSYFTSAGSLMS